MSTMCPVDFGVKESENGTAESISYTRNVDFRVGIGSPSLRFAEKRALSRSGKMAAFKTVHARSIHSLSSRTSVRQYLRTCSKNETD